VTAFIGAVRRLGCRVAMDDFGAGFTSFRNLRALQIDLVKIDGAFIRNIADDRDDQLFVSALVTLAHNLGFETIAEWVLDERTIGVLAGLGVDAIQGDAAGPSRLLAR
jgi:EAL domain-containing protein (putative c-di-GMP-specific phosphodiesterase class I)